MKLMSGLTFEMKSFYYCDFNLAICQTPSWLKKKKKDLSRVDSRVNVHCL